MLRCGATFQIRKGSLGRNDSDRVRPADDDDWTRQRVAVLVRHGDITRAHNDTLQLRSSRARTMRLWVVKGQFATVLANQ
jgi:hypothetical protein